MEATAAAGTGKAISRPVSAWRTGLTDKTVFRAGSGIFYGEPNSLSTEGPNFRSGPPRSADVSVTTTFERTDVFVKSGFPAFQRGVLQRNSSIFVFPDFRSTLSTYQWFADVQRTLPGDAILTVGYIGTKGTHLSDIRNLNQPLFPSANVPATQRRNYPEFNSISFPENAANSSYNSLTAKAERRFSKGFTLLSAFTWAHNIDQAEEDLVNGASGRATDYNLTAERARSTLDRRFAYSLSSVYEIPFGKDRPMLTSGPAAWIAGGWQIGGIVSLLAGLPLDHSINVDNQNLGGRVRGDWVRNPNLSSGERNIERWFDTGFVVPSAPGVISNAGRNLIVAPGRKNLDLMISRNFRGWRESHYVQFRAEAFNATNTPAFGAPNASVGSPGVGRITTADAPRRIQLGLKYVF